MNFMYDKRPSDNPLVEMVWYTRSESAGTFASLAESHWEMVVTKFMGQTNITVRGPETQASSAECPADAEFFGIVFKLGTFIPHMPTSERINRNDITLPEASGNSFWLQGAAWQLPDYENADTFVDRLVREDLLVYDPVVKATLQGHPQDYSPRALQYRFLRSTGLTQNTIQQIDRAKKAMALLRQGTPILDAVYQAGYYDQPHLTRSLKRFTGHTPVQIAHAIMPGGLLTIGGAEETPDSP